MAVRLGRERTGRCTSDARTCLPRPRPCPGARLDDRVACWRGSYPAGREGHGRGAPARRWAVAERGLARTGGLQLLFCVRSRRGSSPAVARPVKLSWQRHTLRLRTPLQHRLRRSRRARADLDQPDRARTARPGRRGGPLAAYEGRAPTCCSGARVLPPIARGKPPPRPATKLIEAARASRRPAALAALDLALWARAGRRAGKADRGSHHRHPAASVPVNATGGPLNRCGRQRPPNPAPVSTMRRRPGRWRRLPDLVDYGIRRRRSRGPGCRVGAAHQPSAGRGEGVDRTQSAAGRSERHPSTARSPPRGGSHRSHPPGDRRRSPTDLGSPSTTSGGGTAARGLSETPAWRRSPHRFRLRR